MMFRQISIVFLLIIISTTAIVSAVRCHSSDCSINLNSTIDGIDTTNCTSSVDDICFTTVRINLPLSEGTFSTTPIDADSFPVFILNGRAVEALTTTVWFRKKSITQLFTYVCTTDTYCGEGRAREMFRQAKVLNVDSLWNNLTEFLHLNSPNNNPMCMNERNEAVTCNNGVCQASTSSESNVITRACVSPRGTIDPTGLIISTKNDASLHPQVSVIYSCNKDRCNDDATVNRVKQILIDSKLLNTTETTTVSGGGGGGVGHLSCFGQHTFIILLILVVLVLIKSF